MRPLKKAERKLCFFYFSGSFHEFLSSHAFPVDFFTEIGYHRDQKAACGSGAKPSRAMFYIELRRRCLILKKNGFTVLVTVLSAVAALTAAAIAVFLFFEKKRKDEEELEHYLDCSIQ